MKRKGKFLKRWGRRIAMLIFLLILAGSLIVLLRVENDYTVLQDFAKTDVSGSRYLSFGKRVLKYSPDGVSCINEGGKTLWNSSFNMQSPIVDIQDNMAVVGDQQGSEIRVFDSEGKVGQMESLLPIEKVRVALNGNVATVQENGEVTWIICYDINGDELVKMRTTLQQSGYPMDIDLSADGRMLAVSFLYADQGLMRTRICFYNFDEVGQMEENHEVSRFTFDDTVAPELFYVGVDQAVAVRNNGFSIYQGKEIPEEKANVSFDEEILSMFRDGEHFGFIFKSDKENYNYKMLLYGMNGRCSMKKYFNMEYQQVHMIDGNIVLSNEQEFQVYSKRGREKVEVLYRKKLEDVLIVPGFRKYLAIAGDSTELIRVK